MQTGFWFRHFPRASFLYRKLARANYEREMELLDVLCDPQRTGIDIGAKVGMYTYRIRDRSSDVIAFEPNPLWHHMLRAVFEGNRAHIEPVAASNVRGHAVLRLPFDHDGSRQFGRSTIDRANPLIHHQIARVEEIEVETRRLDDYDLPSIGFIKIDVEGHELAVLDGGAASIAKHRPNLLVESNDDHQPDGVAKLAAWMRAHDYTAEFMDGRQLHDIARYDRAVHWDNRGIANFLCVHRSRSDAHERLVERVSRG